MDELRIPSRGAGMNGLIYTAGGFVNKPVVIMLHGFPGNERNLDVAQAVRRAGYNVLFFSYRGAWGSGGTFSFQNAREDVASALAWVRTPANAAKYRLDTRKIALVGHSMGGWLAFDGSAVDTGVGCVAGLAAWNIAAGMKILEIDTAARRGMIAYMGMVADPAAGPLRTRGGDLVAELDARGDTWDYLRLAPSLNDRAVLLVSATGDGPEGDPAMHATMHRALRSAGATRVQNVVYTDDHSFSAHRVALSDLVVRWLNNDCASTWVSRR